MEITRAYSACAFLRVTSITIVFCILLETTVPIRTLWCGCFCWPVVSAMLFLLRLACPEFLLAQNGLHTRDIPAQPANLFQALCLSHVHLELQLEKLVSQVPLLMLELRVS